MKSCEKFAATAGLRGASRLKFTLDSRHWGTLERRNYSKRDLVAEAPRYNRGVREMNRFHSPRTLDVFPSPIW